MLTTSGNIKGLADFGDLGELGPGGLVVQFVVQALEVERISDISTHVRQTHKGAEPLLCYICTWSCMDSAQMDERVAQRRCRRT